MTASSSGDSRHSTYPFEDRISSLPDEILHLILSQLSLKEAVTTSVLSHRWRYCWCNNPLISISFPPEVYADQEVYNSVVDSCLTACASNQRVESMSLHINYELDDTIYDRWFKFAREKSVRSLSLYFQPDEYYDFNNWEQYGDFINNVISVPYSVFGLSSLNYLHLEKCSTYFGQIAWLPELETLSLSSVVLNKESLSGLISGSPRLKNLKIEGVDCTDEIRISCPTLETLNLSKSMLQFELGFNCGVKILESPKLRVFSMVCDDFENVILPGLSNSTELDEITMFCDQRQTDDFLERKPWIKLVSCIRGAKTLRVNYWLLEHELGCEKDFDSRPPMFSNLRYLEICEAPFADKWFCAVICLLKECPLLEILNFQDSHSGLDNTKLACDRIFIAHVYDFENDNINKEFKNCTNIARNLKTMEIRGHYGYINLIKLMFFISSHADKLEKIDICPKERIMDKKDRSGFNKLLEFNWISSQVKIIIKYFEGYS